MGWAKLSSTVEPYDSHRRVIGFDTFQGFPSVNIIDEQGTAPVPSWLSMRPRTWPGETIALLESLDLNRARLECFEFEPNISFIQL